ncbi:MAG TPA: hypothetical protein VEL02_07090 [Jatrophihabitantaceae bacterium]|nr:hypothetical protein [Jatrophihabitantaceae bacterium]
MRSTTRAGLIALRAPLHARLFAFIELLVAEAGPKKDLVDALTGAGINVRGGLAATTAELHTEMHLLLTRAQRAKASAPTSPLRISWR